jgi:hypothetical protein
MKGTVKQEVNTGGDGMVLPLNRDEEGGGVSCCRLSDKLRPRRSWLLPSEIPWSGKVIMSSRESSELLVTDVNRNSQLNRCGRFLAGERW